MKATAERNWRFPLSVQVALLHAAWVGLRLLVSYRAIDLGAGTVVLGALAASYALPAVLAALPLGRLSDRAGGAGVLRGGHAAMIAGVVVVMLSSALPLLLVGSTIAGLGHVMCLVGQQTFVAHRSVGGTSDRNFGGLTVAASVGQLVGPLLLTAVAVFSLAESSASPDTRTGLVVLLVVIGLALPLHLPLSRSDRVRVRTTVRVSTQRESLMLIRERGVLRSLSVSAVVMGTVDLLYAFLPVWAVTAGVSFQTLGWLLALRATVSIAGRFGLGALVDRFGRRPLLIVALTIGAVATAAVPFADAWGAIAVMIGLGIALGIPQPLTIAWVVGITPRDQHGAMLGLRLTGNRLAQVVVPLFAGLLAGPLGVAAVFWLNAAALVGAAAAMLRAAPDAGRIDPEAAADE